MDDNRANSVVAGLNAVAILLAAAWLWVMIRQQQSGGYFGPSFEGDVSFAERIDIALQSIVVLGYAAMVGGIAQILALLARRSAD